MAQRYFLLIARHMQLGTNADAVCMEGFCLLATAPPPKTCRFLYVAFGTGLPWSTPPRTRVSCKGNGTCACTAVM